MSLYCLCTVSVLSLDCLLIVSGLFLDSETQEIGTDYFALFLSTLTQFLGLLLQTCQYLLYWFVVANVWDLLCLENTQIYMTSLVKSLLLQVYLIS